MDSLPKPFELAPPTEMEALQYYAQGFSIEKANQIWKQACISCQAEPNGHIEDLKMLNRIFDHLSTLPGLAGVYGMSLKVRLMSYCNLKAVLACENAFQRQGTVIDLPARQVAIAQQAS